MSRNTFGIDDFLFSLPGVWTRGKSLLLDLMDTPQRGFPGVQRWAACLLLILFSLLGIPQGVWAQFPSGTGIVPSRTNIPYLILPASQYINWGTTRGSGGYGIRDNAGTLEAKNSGGVWAAWNIDAYSSNLYWKRVAGSAGQLSWQATEKSPAAVSGALAGAGAGNVDNGSHTYAETCVTAGGETDIGASSGAVTVVDKTVNGKVTVTLVACSPIATGRNVYRSKAGTTTPLYLLSASPVIADGSATATYTDNTADASLLATTGPATNTAINTLLTLINNGTVRSSIPSNGGTAFEVYNSGIASGWALRLNFAGFFNSGIWFTGNNEIDIISNNQTAAKFSYDSNPTNQLKSTLTGNAPLGIYSYTNSPLLYVSDAGGVGVGTTNPVLILDVNGTIGTSGLNGQSFTLMGSQTQLVSVASGVTTQQSTIQIPANAILLAAPMRVVTQPGGTTTMTVTATTSGTILQQGASMSTVATTTDVGSRAYGTNYVGVAAQTVTFTFNVATTNALGQIRLDLRYAVPIAPTS